MIAPIAVSAVAVLFGGVTGVIVLWAGLLAIGFGGALVILAWRAVKFVVRMTWRGFVGVLRLARFVVMAFVHIRGRPLPTRPLRRAEGVCMSLDDSFNVRRLRGIATAIGEAMADVVVTYHDPVTEAGAINVLTATYDSLVDRMTKAGVPPDVRGPAISGLVGGVAALGVDTTFGS